MKVISVLVLAGVVAGSVAVLLPGSGPLAAGKSPLTLVN